MNSAAKHGRRGWDQVHTLPDSPHTLKFQDRQKDLSKYVDLLPLYLGLNVAGALIHLILLGTMTFSRNIRRHPVLVNFCAMWIPWVVSFLFLFLTGYNLKNEVSFPVCLISSGLIHGAPVMVAGGLLSLSILLFTSVHSIRGLEYSGWFTSTTTLVAFPYILLVLFTIPSIAMGVKFPAEVERYSHVYYCTVFPMVLGQISAAFVALFLIASFVLFFFVAKAAFPLRHALNSNIFAAANGVNFALILRVIAFCIYSIGAFALTIVFVFVTDGVAADMILMTMPLVIGLILASQEDYLDAWHLGFLSTKLLSRSSTTFTRQRESGRVELTSVSPITQLQINLTDHGLITEVQPYSASTDISPDSPSYGPTGRPLSIVDQKAYESVPSKV